jgi:hypothetical protein
MKLRYMLLVGLMISSCTGYQHVSSPVYVPLSSKKGDLTTNISPSNLQVGYSFSDRLNVFATGFYRKQRTFEFIIGKENSLDTLYSDFTREITVGGGYLLYKGTFTYTLLAGAGVGSVRYERKIDHYDGYKFNLDAYKASLFVQPNVGLNLNDRFVFNFFTRLGMYHYYQVNYSIYLGELRTQIDPLDTYFVNRSTYNVLFVDPGLSVQIGSEKFKFQTTLFPSFKLNSSEIRYNKFNVHLGMSINLNLLAK